MVADEAAEERSYRQLASNGRVDGVILTDLRHDDPRLRLVSELGLRAVTLGAPDVASPLPAVSLDDAPGIRDAVAHLADLGHHRIAHVAGPSRMLHGTRRRESFAAALRERGLTADLIVETDFTAADGARATHELLTLAERPTAIVYANDPMAIAGVGVAQRLGFRVPEDLSVTGFDGSEVGEWMHPALTSVTTTVSEWGRAAARTLLHLIDEGAASDVDLAAARLVVRESTASPAETAETAENSESSEISESLQ
jgi:DNA-binding LacI/PurR family transcriptional regulator